VEWAVMRSYFNLPKWEPGGLNVIFKESYIHNKNNNYLNIKRLLIFFEILSLLKIILRTIGTKMAVSSMTAIAAVS